MKSYRVKWSGHDTGAKKNERRKKMRGILDPNVDGFHSLLAGEVFTATNAISHIGNPCLMFRVMIILLKTNRPENV